MTKKEYEAKPMTAQDKVYAAKMEVKDTCPLCKSQNTIVKISGSIKTVTCLEGKCQYVAKYKDGKLI